MHNVTKLDEDVWTVENFLTPDECAEFIERGEGLGFEAAGVRTSGGEKMMQNIRNNDRATFEDEELAASLWERVRPYVPAEVEGCAAVGLFPQFRYYRYDPGQRFKRHKDGSVDGENGTRSRLTFLLYLNEGYEGGDTVFSLYEFQDGQTITHEIRVTGKTGLGLLFVHERKHEGAALTGGRKYVLRTDVLYEAPKEVL